MRRGSPLDRGESILRGGERKSLYLGKAEDLPLKKGEIFYIKKAARMSCLLVFYFDFT
jgi:hypothetical protein